MATAVAQAAALPIVAAPMPVAVVLAEPVWQWAVVEPVPAAVAALSSARAALPRRRDLA